MDLETLSIFASIFSLAVSIIAIALSVIFYIAGRNTETKVSNALSEIKSQTDALQKLSGRQIDKLMQHAFSQPKTDTTTQQLLVTLSQLPQTITALVLRPTDGKNQDEYIVSLYIALYFYTAHTNYWSQPYLPKIEEFDENNEFHKLAKRIIDLSHDDFQYVAKILEQYDTHLLDNSKLSHLFNETKNRWRYNIRSSAEVFKNIATSPT